MIRPALLLASLLGLPLAASAANLKSDFTADSEGWTTAVPAGEGVQTWEVSGGNGGGWLRVEDLSGNSDILLTAPTSWLGNWSGFLGGTLSFDAKNLSPNGTVIDWPGFGEIRISNGSTSVLLDIAAAGQPPADGQWQHYSVTLTPAAGWGPSLASVLANVTSLSINGELHAGPGEVVGFDNIQVTAVPEPASLAMLLGGVALLAVRRRWC